MRQTMLSLRTTCTEDMDNRSSRLRVFLRGASRETLAAPRAAVVKSCKKSTEPTTLLQALAARDRKIGQQAWQQPSRHRAPDVPPSRPKSPAPSSSVVTSPTPARAGAPPKHATKFGASLGQFFLVSFSWSVVWQVFWSVFWLVFFLVSFWLVCLSVCCQFF